MKRFVREYASFKKQQATRIENEEQKHNALVEIDKIIHACESGMITEDDAIRELLEIYPLNI